MACNNSVYGNIIDDGVNGFLANELEWYDKLEYVYLNPNKVKSVVKKAREDCILKYSCYHQKKRLEKLYDNILEM